MNSILEAINPSGHVQSVALARLVTNVRVSTSKVLAGVCCRTAGMCPWGPLTFVWRVEGMTVFLSSTSPPFQVPKLKFLCGALPFLPSLPP